MVTICKHPESMLKIYDVRDFYLFAEEDIAYEGHWIEQGDRGFDIV